VLLSENNTASVVRNKSLVRRQPEVTAKMLAFLEPLLRIEATPACILDVEIGIQLSDARWQLCQQPCEKLPSDGSPIFRPRMGTVQPGSLELLIVLAPHRAY
jgi:hypothetical protein